MYECACAGDDAGAQADVKIDAVALKEGIVARNLGEQMPEPVQCLPVQP